MELLNWFTHFENVKPLSLALFFGAFCMILYYVYGSSPRGERLESYREMPFLDDETEIKERKS